MCKACKQHPHLRIKLAIDCIDRGYASNLQIAKSLGLELTDWLQFYYNFKEGDVSRVPEKLQRIIPPQDLVFYTGFTDEQLEILERALEMPLLVSEARGDEHPLHKELRVLAMFGVVLRGRHNQFKSYKVRLD